MKKGVLCVLLFLLLWSGAACAESALTSLEQLNATGITIGVSQGNVAELILKKELPLATVSQFNDKFMGYTAVAQGKIDAFAYDRRQMEMSIENGQKGVHLLEETLNETMKIAVGISPVSKIPDLTGKINRFIAELRADGTLDDMFDRWVVRADETMPDIPRAESPSVHLIVGTSGIVPPYSYYAGKELNGYDIELAYRFAAWLGADVEFKVYDYGAIFSAAIAGDIDCIMANLEYTDERAEEMPYSDLLFEVKIGLMVRGEAAPAPDAAKQKASALDALNGRRIGVATGTTFDAIVSNALPDAKLVYINSSADLIAALEAGKIDGFAVDEPAAKQFCAVNPLLTVVDEYLDTFSFGIVLPKTAKGDALLEELNAWLIPMKESGALERVIEKWADGPEEGKTLPDYASFPATKGTLTLATEGDYVPMTYYRGTEIVGAEIDLIAQFCEANGYGLKVQVMNFDGILPAVQTGKTDFAAAGISITDERRESVNFSVPYYSGGTVMVVRKDTDSGTEQAEGTVRWQDYNGKRLGVLVGPLMEDAAKEYFPDSEYLLFNSYPDCIAALLSGKIDAYLGDELGAFAVHAENLEIDYIHDRITQNNYAFAFRKNDPKSAALCAELNDFLAISRENGTMEDLENIWYGIDEERKVVDMSDLTGENGTIRVVTTSTDMPFSYIKDGKNVGYDIDLVVRFCRDRGYALELGDVAFDGRIPAIQSGKYDFTTDMNVTPEREEQVLFSDPTGYGGIVLVVRSSDLGESTVSEAGVYTSVSQLDGKRIGVQSGTNFDAMVQENLPSAQIDYYIGKADLVAALTGKKVEAFAVDEPVAQILMHEDERLTYLHEYLDDYVFAFAFAKNEAGKALKDQFNAFLEQLPDGTLNALAAKWFDEDEDAKPMPDITALKAENGTLRLATESGYAPFEYIRDGQVVGYDMELAALFCEANGYGLEIVDMNFDAILPAIQTGKCDFAAAGIGVTPERAESVLFSEPDFSGGMVLVVLKTEAQPTAQTAETTIFSSQAESFWDGIVSSFNKTFLRENRWELFGNGVLTTLLITVLSILFGTALGFLVFMLCRNGNIVANSVTRFSMWLVQGMPMVVLLMILYYIIFGSVAISGIFVAVIGFTLTFGASVFGLLKMGVGTIDRGQYEAAYALGYANRRTFFRIILPQAIPHILPAYKGEIVGLIKATAIVGYIAVQDLTKMGDIVRSRTYEAFFPLIAVTVIYFVLEGLLGFLVSKIQIRMNPKKRKPESILKGVNVHD